MRKGDRGFTLLEVLLAITIMGFMTALLWGSFSRTAQIKQRTEAGQDRVHAARVALMRISRDCMRVDQLQRPTLLVLAIGALHQEHGAHAAMTDAPHHAPRADPLTVGWIGSNR